MQGFRGKDNFVCGRQAKCSLHKYFLNQLEFYKALHFYCSVQVVVDTYFSLVPGESYRQALADHDEVSQTLAKKNAQLKAVIDQMREIIWEIDGMLAVR